MASGEDFRLNQSIESWDELRNMIIFWGESYGMMIT